MINPFAPKDDGIAFTAGKWMIEGEIQERGLVGAGGEWPRGRDAELGGRESHWLKEE